MILCVGIDPSLNSTGICLSKYDPDINEELDIHFDIVHNDKLSKKEKIAQDRYKEFFEYHVINTDKYNKQDISVSEFEFKKTERLLKCVETIREILNREFYRNNVYDHAYVCIEGLSYGSTRSTKSIFELAGLNYLIRAMILELFRSSVTLIISPPSVIKKFATGKGNANKEEIIESFKIAFKDFELPKLDDISDAFFMKEIAKKEARDNY